MKTEAYKLMVPPGASGGNQYLYGRSCGEYTHMNGADMKYPQTCNHHHICHYLLFFLSLAFKIKA